MTLIFLFSGAKSIKWDIQKQIQKSKLLHFFLSFLPSNLDDCGTIFRANFNTYRELIISSVVQNMLQDAVEIILIYLSFRGFGKEERLKIYFY